MVARRHKYSSASSGKSSGGWGGFVLILLAAFAFRTLLFQPFTIPSGSMQPGLLEGDYILVNKFATGYGRHSAWPFPLPVGEERLFQRGAERGEVIVFRPEGVRRDLIKRVIARPGDTVAMRDDQVIVNGETLTAGTLDEPISVKEPRGGRAAATVQVERVGELRYATAQVDPALSGFEEIVVPDGYLFVMGDNRDRSGDSRTGVEQGGAGLVPDENVVGEAVLVVFSVNDDFVIWKPWTWWNFRGDRWFKAIR